MMKVERFVSIMVKILQIVSSKLFILRRGDLEEGKSIILVNTCSNSDPCIISSIALLLADYDFKG